jgi:acetophenone carboxylase
VLANGLRIAEVVTRELGTQNENLKEVDVYTIDIDTGGTLTDGVFSDGVDITEIKVDTTPHDITVCLFECLNQGASKLGFDSLKALMKETSVIRWSSTVTTNVLAERTGPKMGLIVTKGYGTTLYGSNGSPVIDTIIDADNILEIKEKFTEEEALLLLKALLERGVRRVVISLKGAYGDRSKEEDIKQWVEDQYPDHYLGAVPVVVGGDICQHPKDETRTNYALMNAYTHGPLAVSLFKAEDQLIYDNEFRGNLLVGLNREGSCRIAKAKAMDTVESGPVIGIFGSARFAEKYMLERVCTLDIGGTTAKFGIIHDRKPVNLERTEFFGIPLDIPSVLLRSVSVGGGTVVKADKKLKGLKIGPESTGGYPGPACYDLGGKEATITDALLLLGLINPDNFLGGERTLNMERASEAIETNVSKPLSLGSAREAAKLIVDKSLDQLTQGFIHTFQEINDEPGPDYVLFAFGGNGALFACLLAERLGINTVKVFRFGSVFSALGSSMSDVTHVYEEFVEKRLTDIGPVELRNTLMSMINNAEVDLKGERFDPKKATYTLEVDVLEGGNTFKTLSLPTGSGTPEIEKAWEKILQEYGGVRAKALRLKSVFGISKYQPISFPQDSEIISGDAKKGDRVVLSAGVPVFVYNSLKNGNIINGPAVVEGDNTTYYIPEGWLWVTDEYLNATIKRHGG